MNSISGMPAAGVREEDLRAADLREVATGRLYIDGEPEVRIRDKDAARDSSARFMLVVTRMGDEDGPVGLTSSLFAAAGTAQDEEDAALQFAATRVTACGGVVLGQTVERIDAPPDEVTTYLVKNLLRSAKAQT